MSNNRNGLLESIFVCDNTHANSWNKKNCSYGYFRPIIAYVTIANISRSL